MASSKITQLPYFRFPIFKWDGMMATAGLFRMGAGPGTRQAHGEHWPVITGSFGADNMVVTKPHLHPSGFPFPCCDLGDDQDT